MDHITAIYHDIQAHPLYWQVPLSLLTTSGLFAWLKHKLELEGKAKITGYLALISAAIALIHAAIIGLTFAGPLGLLKGIGTQATFFLGGLTLTYNFLTTKVVTFLQAAKAAAQTSPATPDQKNQAASKLQAEDVGVVTI